ncbi:hypothetical protein GF360_00945 [candidate division WWE3 bacterium]|nr:hypothetical protein [candidate division WWE3 bacterium]
MKNKPPYQQLLNRTKGYDSKFPRQTGFLIRFLSPPEFCLYIVLVYICTDWDARHTTYEHFKYRPHLIGKLIGWTPNRVYRNFQKLKKKGFVIEVDKRERLYKLTGYSAKEMAAQKNGYIKKLFSAIKEVNSEFLESNKVKIKELFAEMQILPNEKPTNKRNNQSKCTFNVGSYKDDIEEYLGHEVVSEILKDVENARKEGSFGI